MPLSTTGRISMSMFGQQEGRCAGCRMDFPFKIFEVDHVIAQARGGTDHLDNLQLLCPHCKPDKGRPASRIPAIPTDFGSRCLGRDDNG